MKTYKTDHPQKTTISDLWEHRQTVERARNVLRLREYQEKQDARFALYEVYNNEQI